MTAIRRRKMLGAMLGGAVVATAGSMFPVPAESAPSCPAGPVPRSVRRRKVCWWGRRRRILLLALAHAAWLGQAFAHCPLRVLGTITHQTLATWVPAWPHQDFSKRLSVSRKLLLVDTIA